MPNLGATESALQSSVKEISKQERVSEEGPVNRAVRVGLVGATGYAGRELISLLVRHPAARLVRLMSSGRRHKEPVPVEQIHPSFRGELSLSCIPLEEGEQVAEEMDLVFLGTPPEVSIRLVPKLLRRGLRVIDLSGGFRLQDPEIYPRWYGFEHGAPEYLKDAVYGVTELNPERVAAANFVSNPGCYATSAILALAPLLQAGWISEQAEMICDAKSGVSGAGREPNPETHFVEVNENCRAYGLFHHRHVPEILQALALEQEQFRFTPHLLPLTRGILSSLYLRLQDKKSRGEISALFQEFYGGAPLVRIYTDSALPEIKAVQGTNYCDIGFALEESTGRLTVVSCLDNLGKGAAGQAMQNMNLMFGLPQQTGLL